MQFKYLSALALSATTVIADGSGIINAIQAVSAATVSFNATIAGWDGELFGLFPIVQQSTNLLNTIQQGTEAAKKSDELAVLEVITLAGLTQTLVTDVNQTITSLIAAKPEFDHLFLLNLIVEPIVLLNLDQEQSASAQFTKAVIAKVPANLQAIASNLTAPINVSFQQGINAYRLF